MRIAGGVLLCWLILAGMLLFNQGCANAPELTPQQRVTYGLLGVRVACGECNDATCGRDVVELCRQLFPVEVRAVPVPDESAIISGDSGPPPLDPWSGPGDGNGARNVGGTGGQ